MDLRQKTLFMETVSLKGAGYGLHYGVGRGLGDKVDDFHHYHYYLNADTFEMMIYKAWV